MKVEVVGFNTWAMSDEKTGESRPGISVFCVYDDINISKGKKADKFTVWGNDLSIFPQIPGIYDAEFDPKGKIQSLKLAK